MAKIFFVAGSAPWVSNSNRFLAAEKKVQLLIELIIGIGHDVYFIHSAPDMLLKAPAEFTKVKVGELSIDQLTVPRYPYGSMSRILSILDVTRVLSSAVDEWGLPDLIWLYNGYAFEMRFARVASRKLQIPVILEFEDWHFSRSSYLSPKPLIDWLMWLRALPYITSCVTVNSFLSDIMEKKRVKSIVIPGIFKDEILRIRPSAPYISNSPLKVGYFGGLTIDKGAYFLLRLIHKSLLESLHIHFHISGSGPLFPDFQSIARRYPNSVFFYGCVNESAYPELIQSVDVLLNPHLVMPGVFPFKILEYIASGRPIISGPLPQSEKESTLCGISKGVIEKKLDVDTWLQELTTLDSLRTITLPVIEQTRSALITRFGIQALSAQLEGLISSTIN